MRPDRLRELLDERFGAAVTVGDDPVVPTADVDPESWVDVLTYARDALECAFFDWLSAVDEQDEGLRVVAHLWSPRERHHLLVRTLLPGEAPRLATATEVFRGANWHERETAEMFGVTFTGHPNPQPLLLPDGFEGHPLRKDFVLASRVAKTWPGEKDPGESGESTRKRRRMRPPGVPEPEKWGPRPPGGEDPGGETPADGDPAPGSAPDDRGSGDAD